MVICSTNRFDDMSNARRWYKITGRLILLVTMVSLLFVCFSVNPSLAGIRHDLRISLHPESNRLLGRDYIEVQPEGQAKLTLSMSPRAIIRKMVVNEKVAPYHFSKGRLTVPLDPGRAAPSRIFVSYEAVFDDPYPEAPANSDNPGYGVTGIVGPKGTFLLSGSGWYPQGDHGASQFSIVVDAPEGIVAVTAGRSAGRKTEGRRTHSYWVVNHPSEGLSLSAGRYVVTETALGGIQVATYFLPQTQHLAERYIAATGRYLKMYAKLFGPYPFEKFAVVENFFPTGYGFPSYTLMGGAVLRLPFIVDVSLGHEIAHCWWGNGVKIDFATGNWSEGLTTYVADDLYKEQESTEAARQYRQQWLRNYAALIDENTDFPLARFIGRVDRQTKVIGYDKAAMVFHMLRKNLGEKAFWGALRDIFREKLFEEASWENFRLAFQRRAASGPHGNLKEFFAQWVFRDGGPDLALADLSREAIQGGWRVSGQVIQKKPTFALSATVRIRTAAKSAEQILSLTSPATAFAITVADKPLSVILDPDGDLFRRLRPEEIPASINSIKGADSVTVVIADGAGMSGKETARMLVRALGLSRARIIGETELGTAGAGPGARIYIGFPKNSTLVPTTLAPVQLSPSAVTIEDRSYIETTDIFFGVFADSKRSGQVSAILAPLHPKLGPIVARKVTHYGKYSYLVFRQGKNAEKGVWPVTKSPMIFRWDNL